MGSVHFDSTRRAVQVEQTVVTPAVVTASTLPFASLRFTAFGGPVDVTQVTLAKTHGPGTLPDITAFTVTPATPVTRTAAVTYTSADVGAYITARVDPAGVLTTGNVPVTVDGPDLVAYLSNIAEVAPTDHRVEGYFGDWGSLAVDSNNLRQDGNVDIERYGANHTVVISPASSTAFVYADVAGRIFNGAGVVEHIDKPTGGGGGGQGSPPPAIPRVGDDVFRAYISLEGPVSGGTRSDPILSPMQGNGAESVTAQALTGGAATIDGNCATVSGEYNGAGSLSNGNMSGKVGTNGVYVFVCVDVTIDITNDALDAGTLYFDPDHNAGALPSGDDRKFRILPGGTLGSFKGNGLTWE